MPLLPPCPLERLRFVFSAGSKSLTIVHAHPSHFITTSELILEDFRESQANFASETLIFLSAIEHEMTIKLMNNIYQENDGRYPSDSPSSSLSMLQFYTSLEPLNVWTLCTQMQDQSGHGPETNSSIFRRNVETLLIRSGWFSNGATNKGLRKFSWGLFHGMERGVLLYRPHIKTREKIWLVLISAGTGCVGTNQGFGKLRWVWTKCGKLNQGQP